MMKENESIPAELAEEEEMTWEEAQKFGYFEEKAITLQEVLEASEGADADGKAL